MAVQGMQPPALWRLQQQLQLAIEAAAVAVMVHTYQA
jgi:hypothetical protein